MHISVQSFWLPKSGNTPQEYEDDYDFSYNKSVRGKREAGPHCATLTRTMVHPRFAIADGATESSFSGLWAQLLVKTYVDKAPQKPLTLRKWVEQCSHVWQQNIGTLQLPWYAQNKAQKGAFAALLGLTLRSSKSEARSGGTWSALAVGDACLFQIRQGELLQRFPIQYAAQFGYHPLLLSSIPEKNRSVWAVEADMRCSGTWLPGDTFFLATDALAQWFLAEVEQGRAPWQTLQEMAVCALAMADSFPQWVEMQRHTGMMRNDDVTLLRIMVNEHR